MTGFLAQTGSAFRKRPRDLLNHMLPSSLCPIHAIYLIRAPDILQPIRKWSFHCKIPYRQPTLPAPFINQSPHPTPTNPPPLPSIQKQTKKKKKFSASFIHNTNPSAARKNPTINKPEAPIPSVLTVPHPTPLHSSGYLFTTPAHNPRIVRQHPFP